MMTFHSLCLNTLLLILLFGTMSCDKNLTAEIPSYIEIKKFDYEGNNDSVIPYPNGYNNYNSTNITDAWISMNGEIIGVFEIPCKIPILSVGSYTFNIYPGIKVNGIAGSRIKYPFYEKFETNLTLETDETILISPVTSYMPKTLFEFEQQGQFEIEGTMLEKASMSDTSAIIQNEIVFQGERASAIYLDSINTYFDIRNIEELNLDNNTFLELNFKSTITFNVGLIIINEMEEKHELIQLYATENWKKIYLDLSPLINAGNSLSKFKIYFEGNYNNTEPINSVYLDNLKMVFSK